MTNVKISELIAADTLDGTEEVPVVQGGVTKRTTPAEIVGISGMVLLASGTIASPVSEKTITFDLSPYRYAVLHIASLSSDNTDSVGLELQMSPDEGLTFFGEDELNYYQENGGANYDAVLAIPEMEPGFSISSNAVLYAGSNGRAASLQSAVGTTFTLSLFSAASIAVVNGGSGYSPSDIISFQLNDILDGGTAIVDTVGGGGAITAAHLSGSTTYSKFGSRANPNPVGVDSSPGTGATFNITWTDLVTVPINALRFFVDGANITAADYSLWGVI